MKIKLEDRIKACEIELKKIEQAFIYLASELDINAREVLFKLSKPNLATGLSGWSTLALRCINEIRRLKRQEVGDE